MEHLFAIYVGCLVFGGSLVTLSLFADHDTDADMDADLDVDVDMDCDVELDADLDADHDFSAPTSVDVGDALWLPFLSLRFYLFFAAFFGLTGTVLDGLSLSNSLVTLGTALGIGFTCGYVASRMVQVLRSNKVSGHVDPERDYAGRQGTVLLDVTPSEPGQVRIDVKGSSIDLPAEAIDGSTFTRGSKVIVVKYENQLLKVAEFDTGEKARPNRVSA